MRKLNSPLLGVCLLISSLSIAQNPFESIGKTTKPMLSLSDGKYIEHFNNDSVRQIGSAMVNVYTEQIVAFVDRKEQAKKIHSQTSSRFLSVDPLAREYPYYTPYQYAGNTPIQAIDIDGAEPGFVQGNGTWVTQRDGDLQRPISQQGEDFFKSKQPTEYHEGLLEGLATDIVVDIGTTIASPISKAVYGQDLEGNKVSGTDRVLAGIEIIQIVEGVKGGGEGGGGKPNTSPKIQKSNYKGVDSKAGAKAGGDFTRAQKKSILDKNKQANGGVIKSDKSGAIANQPSQSKKGVAADMNQAEIDHIIPKSKGGTNAGSNAQVLTKKENLEKGDK